MFGFCNLSNESGHSKKQSILKQWSKLFLCSDCFDKLIDSPFEPENKINPMNQDELGKIFKRKSPIPRAKDITEAEILKLLDKEGFLSTNEMAVKLDMSKEWIGKILRTMQGLRRSLRGVGNKQTYYYSLEEKELRV